MSIEKEISDYYISMFTKYNIDFLHLKNAGHKRNRGAYSYAVFSEGADNNKYWADFQFCFMGVVYQREVGEPGKHKERKEKQAKRMLHWADNGNVNTLTVYDMKTAMDDWKKILGNKKT